MSGSFFLLLVLISLKFAARSNKVQSHVRTRLGSEIIISKLRKKVAFSGMDPWVKSWTSQLRHDILTNQSACFQLTLAIVNIALKIGAGAQSEKENIGETVAHGSSIGIATQHE